MKETLNYSLRIVFFTVVPAMVGLIVLGIFIIELLFEHGRFTHNETLLTNAALIGYCFGLPAFASAKVVISAFYSMKDTKTPFRVATFAFLINMVGNLSLMWTWGVGGLAIATTIASTVNVVILLFIFRKRMGIIGGKRLLVTFSKTLMASALMGVFVWLLMHQTAGSLLWRVPVVVFSGVFFYGGLAYLFRIEEIHSIRQMIFRKSS